LLIPPFYTAGGDEIRVGRNVFVNQNCTFYDLGGLDIADDVMIGPNVSIIGGVTLGENSVVAAGSVVT
jgi:acetyltransferase-like isoleucine patch superfamily enzyme